MLRVTPHSQISSDGISSLRVGRFKDILPPPPSSLLPPTHRPHPPASPLPSPFPSLPLFTFFFTFLGPVTSNLCFTGSRDDLRDDISVSAERLPDLNCNLKGQIHRGRGGALCVTMSYVTVRFPVTSFLSESCLREQVVSKTPPLSPKKPVPLTSSSPRRFSTPVTLLSSPATLDTSISRPLLHLFVQHRPARS